MNEHYLKEELYELVRTDPKIFDFLQHGSLDGVWYWDLEDTDHEWMSPQFWETFGHDPSEKAHLSSEWQDMIDPEDLKVALANFHRHQEDPDQPYDQVVRYRHKDGSTVYIRCRGLIIRDQDGKPRRMLGAHTDVTALKEAEQKFREQALELATQVKRTEELRRRAESAFEHLYDTSPDMHVSVDAKTATVRRCNATAARKLGYSKEQMVGQRIFDFYHPDCMPAVQEAFEQFQSSGSVRNAELVLVRANGEKIPVLLSVQAIRDAEGKVLHSVSTWRDITGIKQFERLQAMASSLQRSNAELEQFAYVVSHDLQEPLRMVSSFTRLLAEQLEGNMTPTMDKYLGFVLDGASRMQLLIQDLLAFSRVGHDAAPTKVDALEVVQSVLVDLSEPIKTSGGAVTVDDLPTVTFNETELRQLFQNLISNALKFSGQRTPRIKIGARREGSSWVFIVQDNGIGIEEAHQDQIFGVFKRLHARQDYEGTGVGLAICKKIIDRNDGNIWVDSEPGRGSTFSFTIAADQTTGEP